ncbi:cell envelope biogenesis protein TolA [Bradyrhizobium yuanmingense]|uniref:Colicin import membrane protein n=1 Tax=Bradyrhizobium yuanmingense TaxID=108015 RepID=A0ABV4G9D8_9BRAD|nr:cell envelope biogenesis protein TolA [Bradyrhizobium yuanmingense]
MKAALEARGAGSNLFHQGVAKETDDADVVAATMSKPGVVLKAHGGIERPLRRAFRSPVRRGIRREPDSAGKKSTEAGEGAAPNISEREARKAAADFDKEQKRREAERRREEAARERQRRERATAKAKAALDKAQREHDKKAGPSRPRSRRLRSGQRRG